MYVWILDWLYLLVVMISSSKVDEFFPIKGFLVVVYPSHSARVGQTTDVLGLAFFSIAGIWLGRIIGWSLSHPYTIMDPPLV
jgi:hypothetical protein